MKSITFHCETITPMFLAGADGQTPELRPPSIKGALRFWWRAMNAGLVEQKKGKWDYSKLKKQEAEIFGGTDEKSGRSQLVLNILSKQPSNNNLVKEKPLPHKKKGEKGYFEKQAIEVGFKFHIQIGVQKNTILSAEQVKSLFIVFSILGGIGNRSRRGFGSFKIEKINNEPFGKEINEKYTEGEINKIEKPNSSSSPSYPFIKRIDIGKEAISLFEIGQITHNEKIKNGGSRNYFKYENSIGNSNPRYSSPIYVSVIEKEKGVLYPVITTLNAVPPNNRNANNDVQNNFKNAILKI
jgi:CRISPR-associated protein Cmr1